MVTGGRKANAPVCLDVQAEALRHHRLVPATSGDGARTLTLVGCGQARSDHSVIIVDPQTRTRVADDCIGEIWVRGGGVSQGYWNDPARSLETFSATLAGDDATPFLRTGDLGCMRDGELFVTGRIKDLVIIRGVKHYPHDIEQTVQQSHPALEGCAGAVFAIDEREHECLVITQELQRAHRKSCPDEILEAIRARVAERHHVQPHSIVLLRPGQVRRTSSGKIQRQACREAYLDSEFEAIAVWMAHEGALKHEAGGMPAQPVAGSPGDDRMAALEQWLIAQLAPAVGVSDHQIDPCEPFARYGLDSANAVSLASQIAERLGHDLPATLFWDHPTIRSLATVLARDYAAAHPPAPVACHGAERVT
jgi:acyl carrier protein